MLQWKIVAAKVQRLEEVGLLLLKIFIPLLILVGIGANALKRGSLKDYELYFFFIIIFISGPVLFLTIIILLCGKIARSYAEGCLTIGSSTYTPSKNPILFNYFQFGLIAGLAGMLFTMGYLVYGVFFFK